MSTIQKGTHIKIFGRKMPMPKTRLGRQVLGITLIIGGFLGFLPILGFWMLPLGIVVLSYDSSRCRRFRRRLEVWFTKRWRTRRFRSLNANIHNMKKKKPVVHRNS